MTRTVVTVLLGLALVAAVAFPLRYHMLAPWRSSREGRHLMAFTVTMALLLGRIMLARLDIEADWYVGVDLAIVLAIVYVMWRQWWLLERAQHPRRAPSEKENL